MANEIVYRDPHGTTGLNIYVQRFTPTFLVWNGTSHVAFNAANWTQYAVTLTDRGGGFYSADMPTAAAGLYYFLAYQRAGGTPAATDAVLNAGATPMEWDGSAEVPLSTRLATSSYTAPDNAGITTAASQATVAATNIGIAGAGLTAIGDTRLATAATQATAAATALGTAGSGLTAIGDTRLANLDATVSSRLAPTASGRTLDVTAGGAAGIDWGNLENPTATNNLTNTTISIASGGGSVIINQDYPTPGNLRFQTSGGQGIGSATVRAYLASEYAANPAAATIRGQTYTLDSGDWANNMQVDPGDYIITFDAVGYQLATASVTVA